MGNIRPIGEPAFDAGGTLKLGSREHHWLQVATVALQREDRALNLALRQNQTEAYAKVNQGLGYWLYETTLVYVIFKAWAPMLHVVWDWPASAGQKRRADLQILEDGKTSHAFEAKWCNTGANAALKSDAQKIRTTFSGTPRRFLLAFWWNKVEKADADIKWLEHQCAKDACNASGWFVGRFTTDVRRADASPNTVGRDESGTETRQDVLFERSEGGHASGSHYFAIAALEV
jgi:hypothetical protein